ncbi:metallophosphoesterase family protein [Paenibacillus marinisediminis]
MHNIAILSDIHGNLQALEAVLEDMEREGVERIICLGDLVGKGPDSVKVLDILFSKCDVIVRGNWDELVVRIENDMQFRWHAEQLGLKRLNMLDQLPFSYDCLISGRHIRLFHASPQSVYHRVQPWDPLDKRLGMFEFTPLLTDPMHPGQSPDMVVYGDIHQAYLQHLQGKTLINCGSVGNPLDMTQASYVILQGVYGSVESEPFSIQFRRVPYDIEKAVRAAENTEMPGIKEYVRELRTGVYRGLQKSEDDV